MSKEKSPKEILDAIADDAIERVLSLPDDQVLAEAQERYGDVDAIASKMDADASKLILNFKKSRMKAAREAAGKARADKEKSRPSLPETTSARRELYNRIIVSSKFKRHATLAHREKESPPSDHDITVFLEQLIDHGFSPDDDE